MYSTLVIPYLNRLDLSVYEHLFCYDMLHQDHYILELHGRGQLASQVTVEIMRIEYIM